MTYAKNLPASPQQWQILPHRPVKVESEWWGWEVLDLMVAAPSILIQYLHQRLRARLAFETRRGMNIRGEKDKSSGVGALGNQLGK